MYVCIYMYVCVYIYNCFITFSFQYFTDSIKNATYFLFINLASCYLAEFIY